MTTFLIIFPTKDDNIETIIINKQLGSDFVKEMLMILDRIDCEKDVEVYIDSENKDKFLEDYRVLEDLMSQRIGLYNLEVALGNFITQNAIRILRGSNFEPDIQIKLIGGFTQVDRFFAKKNEDRVLNRIDFRHCENHPDRLHYKSPLIGGTNGFDNANNFLPSAIGDVKTSKNILLNIDVMNNNFILRYEDENFNNQYHSYHIVKRIDDHYVVDDVQLQQLRFSKKNLRRSLKLIEYRLK